MLTVVLGSVAAPLNTRILSMAMTLCPPPASARKAR